MLEPVYEYYCPECGAEFELIRPMNEFDAPASCPSCESKAEKLVSAVASKVDFYVRPATKAAFRQHSLTGGKQRPTKISEYR